MRLVRTSTVTAVLLVVMSTLAGATASTASAGTASIADVTLGSVAYSHTTAGTASGTLVLTASEAASLGWHVTVQSSALVHTGGGADIPAANLVITSAGTPAMTTGQPVDPTGGPTAGSAAVGALDSARTVLTANPAYGVGTYTQALGVQVAIPVGARAGTYTATLTVTNSTGP